MAINKINYKYFNFDNNNDIENQELLITRNNDDNITFFYKNISYFHEYSGIKIIKTQNTNKTIKDLIYKNSTESYIKINDIYLRHKDIIIISPFTKISDILNDKTNGNLHNYLKERNCFQSSANIEKEIIENIKKYEDKLEKIIDYDLSKCDIINFIDIKEDFIDENNIKDVLDILKSYDRKITIIFNDVDYLKYESIIDYFSFFNFLFFVNGFDDGYKKILNYEDYLIEFTNEI